MLYYGGNFPEKINLTPGANGGIHCQKHVGPAFGTASCFDVQLWNKASRNLSYLSLGNGYVCPPNVRTNSFSIGNNPLHVEEVEVFEVNFL